MTRFIINIIIIVTEIVFAFCFQVETLKCKILKCKEISSNIAKEALENAINELLPTQQAAVRTCFETAKLRNNKRARSSTMDL